MKEKLKRKFPHADSVMLSAAEVIHELYVERAADFTPLTSSAFRISITLSL